MAIQDDGKIPSGSGTISGVASFSFHGTGTLTDASPSILLQTFVIPGAKTTDGQIIEAVAWPWFEIIKRLQDDPEAVYRLHWRQWEEIIAGAYDRRGFNVILTPRSNDKGRDIIATKDDLQIRIVDQVKAYSPGHLVTLPDVDAMLGVLSVTVHAPESRQGGCRPAK